MKGDGISGGIRAALLSDKTYSNAIKPGNMSEQYATTALNYVTILNKGYSQITINFLKQVRRRQHVCNY